MITGNNIDYPSFFKHTDTLHGGDFLCRFYRHAGPATPGGGSRYPILFVLQGCLDLSFILQGYRVLEAGSFIVIDREGMDKYLCNENTIVLEYSPPERMSGYFRNNSFAFRTSFSNTAPILDPLLSWIAILLADLVHPEQQSEATWHMHRKALAKTLLGYPHSLLGELYVPFYACARNSCRECMPPPHGVPPDGK